MPPREVLSLGSLQSRARLGGLKIDSSVSKTPFGKGGNAQGKGGRANVKAQCAPPCDIFRQSSPCLQLQHLDQLASFHRLAQISHDGVAHDQCLSSVLARCFGGQLRSSRASPGVFMAKCKDAEVLARSRASSEASSALRWAASSAS